MHVESLIKGIIGEGAAMRLLKRAWTVFATLVVVTLLVAMVIPKTAHALAAALVQIVPGTTTHVGQNESQLVSLLCAGGNAYCTAVDPTGAFSSTPYVVPSGYTLIVTDWEWIGNGGAAQGNFAADSLRNPSDGVFANSAALVTTTGTVTYAHEHYASGIRVGSGVTIEDFLAAVGDGFANVQGYLVPN
jgi:hypothetical protein